MTSISKVRDRRALGRACLLAAAAAAERLQAQHLPACTPRLAGTCSKCGTRPFCFQCVADYLEKVRLHWLAHRRCCAACGVQILLAAPSQGNTWRSALLAACHVCFTWLHQGHAMCMYPALLSLYRFHSVRLPPHSPNAPSPRPPQSVRHVNSNSKAMEKGRNIARNRPQDLFAQVGWWVGGLGNLLAGGLGGGANAGGHMAWHTGYAKLLAVVKVHALLCCF